MRVHVCGNAELKFKVIFEYCGSSRLAWVMRVKHGEKIKLGEESGLERRQLQGEN